MSALMDQFQDMLKDVYYAEKQIYKALPKMIRAASDEELAAGFETHREDRLEQVFEHLDMGIRGKKCPAIDGILEEGAELIEEHEKGAGLDAALAAAAQAVEHYEIARYGTLCSWARALDLDEVHALLAQNLDQEETCDKTLSKLAIATLNPLAASSSNGEDGEAAEMAPPRKAAKSAAKPKRAAAHR